MKTYETCGFVDVVWKNNWWKCSKCNREMPKDYERLAKDCGHWESLLLKKASEK